MNVKMIDNSIIEKRSVYYTTILSHVITKDGKYLVCGVKSGKLALFPIQNIVKQNIDYNNAIENSFVDEKQIRKAQQIVSTSSPVYSLGLTQNNNQIICGSKGQIQSWNIDNNELTKEWSVSLSSNDLMVNSIEASDDVIFTGCGDNNVYGFDIESNKQIIGLKEHKDYINCIILSNDKNLLFSGSEDGSVLVWDLRSHNKSIKEIIPHQNSDLCRPNYGKWIGALALTSDDWLVCGGGPHLSLWHLSSLSSATIYETDCATNVVKFHNDCLLSGGNVSDLLVWEMSGEIRSTIPTSASNIFSICNHEYKDNDSGAEQVISCAGSSHKIDICTNWKYKDFELLVS